MVGFSFVAVAVVLGAWGVRALPTPSALPPFSVFETGVLAAEASWQNVPDKDDKPVTCEQRVTAAVEQQMDDLHLEFRTNISAFVADQRRFAKACGTYLEAKQAFQECPRAFIHKQGAIAFLELACRIRRSAVEANADCLVDMERGVWASCRQACISRDYPGMEALFDRANVHVQCVVSTCIARCVNQQVAECGEQDGMPQLYADLAGAQLLMGVEHVLGAGTSATSELVQSARLPVSCRRLIWRSVLAAGNMRATDAEKVSESLENPF